MKNYFKRSEIKPRGTELIACSELMSRIDDLAPSDASVSAIIQRRPDGMFHTLIPIRAAGGSFFSEAQTNSLISSLRAAQSEMLSKLRDWKQSRF